MNMMTHARSKGFADDFSSDKTDGEYVIYTFDPVQDAQSGFSFPAASPWRKVAALGERGLAMARARSLAQSGQFERVELKRKYFCKRNGRLVEALLKTYGSARNRKSARIAFGALILAVVSGVLALSIAYMLGQ